MESHDISAMIDGYIEALLFTADEETIPPTSGEFDASPHLGRLTKAFKAHAEETCKAFYDANAVDLADYPAREAGHDLAYTRNHHGCGYWEADHCTDEQGERLTAAAHRLREVNVFKQRGWFYVE